MAPILLAASSWPATSALQIPLTVLETRSRICRREGLTRTYADQLVWVSDGDDIDWSKSEWNDPAENAVFRSPVRSSEELKKAYGPPDFKTQVSKDSLPAESTQSYGSAMPSYNKNMKRYEPSMDTYQAKSLKPAPPKIPPPILTRKVESTQNYESAIPTSKKNMKRFEQSMPTYKAESFQPAPSALPPPIFARTNSAEKKNVGLMEISADATTIRNAADEVFLCPLSSVLPLDPVTAEDGVTYERAAIEKVIKVQGRNLRSPITNEKMGRKLIPAVHTRHAIEQFVRSGLISGSVAWSWKKYIRDEEALKLAFQGVENRDTLAMCRLGNWYSYGQKGLEKDKSRGYAWYKAAAERGCIKGMAYAGICLLTGDGVGVDETQGMTLLGVAAQGGSDLAAYWLSICFKDGKYGLSKNDAQEKLWLQRLVDKKVRTGFVGAPFNHIRELLAEVNGQNSRENY